MSPARCGTFPDDGPATLALDRRSERAEAVVAHGTTNGLVPASVLAAGRWEA